MSKKNKLKAELILEVAQLQERVKELESATAKSSWYDVIESSPDHILILDPDLKIQYVNHPSPGLTIEELVGKPILMFLEEEIQEDTKAILMKVLNTEEPAIYETEYQIPGGGIMYYETHAKSRKLAGKVVGLILNSRDISQRYQAEVESEQQEQRIQSIFRSAPVGIGVVKNRIFIEVNDRLCAMTGYSEDELINQNARMVYPTQEDYEYVGQEKYNQIGKSGTGAVQTRFQRKDGEVIDVLLSSTPIDRGDLSKGVTFTALDITEMVKAQTALLESEKLLNATQQLTKAGGWSWNVENKTMFWTDETYHIHEIDRTEIEPGSMKHIERDLECYDEKVRQVILQAFQKCADEGISYDLEFPFTTVKGNRIWVRTTAQAEKENDKVVNVVGNIVDITERMQVEIELKEVAQQWQTTFDAITDAVFLMDAESRITRTNQVMDQMFPDHKGKTIGKYCWQIVHGSQEPIPGCPVLEMRKSLQRESERISIGDYVFEVIVDPILDEFGKLAGAVHMMRDITAKIQAEKELSESEEKFRILYNNSPDMYVSVSPRDGSVLLCNETLLTKTGFSREEIIGHHVHNLYHEDCQDEVKEVFQEFVKKGIILDRELILKRKDGGRIEVSLNVDSVRGEEGEILYSISSWRDITERVLMVENLKKEKEFSEKIINTSNAIIVGLDKNHLIKIFNRGAEKITGHKSQDVLGKDWFKVFIPAEILGELDQVWEGAWGAPAHSYINLVRIKNGSERIISWQSTGMYDEGDTKNQLLISIGEDITERKQAENALLEREDELRLMINNSPAGFSRTDMKGHFMDVNPAMCLMVGYSKEELLSKHFNDISHPDDTEKNREIYQTLVDEKIEYFDLEKRYIHKNGKIVHVLIRSQLVRNYEGKPLFEFALVEDITERVLAEEEIQQRTEDLMLINTINDATNLGMDLMEILTLFDEEAKRVFSCKSTSVYLYNEDQNYLEMQNLNLAPDLVKRIEKLIGTNLPDIRIPIEERSYTWELLMTEGPCLINDSETIQQWMLEFTNIFGLAEKTRPVIRKLIAQIYKLVNIQSLITVPMISAGKTVGLMDISRREPFTEQDKTRFASVVGQVTSAITSLRAKSEKTRNQNLLLTLSQAAPAINQANNADEIYRAIGEHAVKMDFDVTVFTLTDDRKYLAVAYHNLTGLARKAEKLTGLSERSYQFPLVLGGFYHKILMGKQAVFSQLDYDPLTEALPKVPRPVINKIMDLFGRQQSIIAPLTVRGEEFGLLSFSGSDLTRSDLPAITTFVNQAAIALEKIRLFTETKELAAFNEGIVQNMAEGIAIEDPDGIFTFVNPAGERLLGYQNGELVGKHWKTITPLDQQPLVLAQNKKRSQGESSQYEVDLINKEGQRISVLGSASPFTDEHSRFIGSLVVFTDITERNKAAREIQQHVKRLDALRTIDNAIMGSFDLEVILNIVLEQLLSQLEVDAAAILSYQADLQALEFIHGRGFKTTALQHTNLRLGEGYAGQVALNRDHVFIPDLNQDDGKIYESPQFSKEGFVAYYGVPLTAKGKLVGVLEIFHRSALEPDVEWVNYLRSLVGQVAIAIDNSTLFSDLQRSNVSLTLAYDATIEGWAHTLELKDMETEGHSRRVVKITMDLAQTLGISAENMVHIRRGALLHDIGKMGIPDAILHKPGKLTDEEWLIMRQHPIYTLDWLYPIEYLRPALEIPYSHHEKWDGTGYPRGIKEEQIPLAARIFAVVDVWDALTSDRPYRKAWSNKKALDYIKEQSGKHFDPRVVEVFLKHIHSHG